MSSLSPTSGRASVPVPRPIRLAAFNGLDRKAALELLSGCLGVPRWSTTLVLGRPYSDYESLLETARDAAYPLTSTELDAAVDHHLRSRRAAGTRPLSDGRLLSSVEASSGVPAELLSAYAEHFDRPFIVRAAGRSTAEMGIILRSRLLNAAETEDRVVAAQLRQIALLALSRRVIG